MNNENIKPANLTDDECRVLREGATESPGSGVYLHGKRKGTIYANTAGTLFFHQIQNLIPAQDGQVSTEEIEDNSHGMHRIETRWAQCHSHLGRKFNDGPTDSTMRYCMNSVCLLHSEYKDKDK